LSAGTTIVLIEANFAVSSWVENMNFVEIIAYGLLILFFITFNRSLFLANLGEINYSNYCCQKDGSKATVKMILLEL
jgi:hypothetical protein